MKARTIACFVVLVCIGIMIALSGCAGYGEKDSGLESITGNVVKDTATAPTPPAEPFCDDNDHGDEPTLKGTSETLEGSQTDYCQGTSLIEYYCEGLSIQHRSYSCKFGCVDGKCLLTKPEPVQEPLVTAEPTPEPAPQPQPEIKEYNEEAVEEELEEVQEQEQTQREQEKKQVQDQFYNCYNGFKDDFETDVDCGGTQCKACGYGQMCKTHDDCGAPLKCNVRTKKCLQTVH